MLPRNYRLTPSKRINRVKSKGRRVTNRSLVISWLERETMTEKETTKVALIVSTRVAKQAVKRHQIKRWLRELVWRSAASLKPGHDIVIIAKRATKELGFEALKDDFQKGFQKAGLFKN